MNERGVVITTALFSGIVLIIISALLFVGYFAVSTGTGSDSALPANASANRTGGVNPTTTITPLTNNRTTPPFVGGGGGGGRSSSGGGSSSGSSGGGNQAPTARISATPSSGAAPLTVLFNGSQSSDPEGQALTYLWSWNNGTNNLTHTNVSFSTVFVNSANYTISLRVTDSAGAASALANVVIRVCSGTCNQTTDTTAPTVSLSPIQPGNNVVVINPVISSNYFLASVADNLGLANATFYLWNANTHQLISKQEAALSGISTSASFPISPTTITLPVAGSYLWNVQATDLSNNRACAPANFTFTYTLPVGGPLSFVAPTPADGSVLSATDIPVNVSSQGNRHYTFVDFNRDVRLWLTMDSTNASGSPVDVSTWNNQVSLKQGANISTGVFGNALLLKAGSQKPYLRVADSPNLRLNSTGHMTISAWIKRDSEYGYSNAGGADNSTVPWTTIVNKVDMNSLNGWELSLSNNGTEVVFRRNGATVFDMRSSPMITNGAWMHVAFVYDGSSVTQYINGVQAAYDIAPTVWGDSNEPLYIGARSVDGAPWQAIMFNGSIDEVMVLNRAFSGSEMQAFYNVTSAVYHNYANLTPGSYSFTAYDRNSTATNLLTRSVTLSGGVGGSIPVCTIQDLNAVRNNLAGNYVQTCDVDLSAVEWVPIGSSADGSNAQPFTGSYNGNGWSISGLTITQAGTLTNSTAEKGLFARLQNAQLSYITLNGGFIEADAGQVGGIAGYVFNSSLDQTQVNGLTVRPLVGLSQATPSSVGGIVGNAKNSSLKNSWVDASSLVGVMVGGVAGSVSGPIGTTITSSTVERSVFQGLEAGGVVGSALGATAQPHSISKSQLNVTVFCDDFSFNAECSAGGVVGSLMDTQLSEAYVHGIVQDVSKKGVVGGVVGRTSKGNTFIDMSHTRATVEGNGNVGGFVGILDGLSGGFAISRSSVRDATVRWNANGFAEDLSRAGHGGFAGKVYGNGQIIESFVLAAIQGGMETGGFVGSANDSHVLMMNNYAQVYISAPDVAGGFIARPGLGTIRECYTSPRINLASGSTLGGFSALPVEGGQGSSLIYNAFWDDEVAGGIGSPEGKGRTTIEMFQQVTFDGFDFNNTWTISEGNDYPRLAWEPSVLFSPSEGNFVQRNFAAIMLVHGILFVLLLIILVFYYYRGRKSSLGSVSPAPSMTPARPTPPSSPSARPASPISKPVQMPPRPTSTLPARPSMPAGPLNFKRPVQFGSNRPSTAKK